MKTAQQILDNPEDYPFYGKSQDDIKQYLAQGLSIFRDQLVPTQGFVPPGQDMLPLQRAAIQTSTSGGYNRRFGPLLTAQFFRNQNAFGILPHEGYAKGGFRMQTARAVTGSIGVAELANIPTSVIASYLQVAVPLKEFTVGTEFSLRFKVTVGKDDTIELPEAIQNILNDFMHRLDVYLLQDFDTLAGVEAESLDRLTASTAARTALGYTDGDEDWHGIDRSANAFADSYNNNNGGVARTLTKELIDALRTNLIAYWGKNLNNKTYLTGPGTWTAWSQIEAAKQRFNEAQFSTGVGGLTPTPGRAGGFKLNTYDTDPIVIDPNVVTDVLPRVYHLDLSTILWTMGREFAATSSDDPLVVGRFAAQTVFYGIGELWGKFPRASGQLRDLQ